MKTFRGFQVFDFKYRSKSKTRNPRKWTFFLLKSHHKVNVFYFWVIFQSVFRFWVLYTTKNISKSKLSEISDFSILTYTQNRKLGNLGKFYFTSNFDSSCNLRCKNNKKISETKSSRSSYASGRKKENFRGFRVFDFVLYPKSKTWKSRRVFFHLEFWQ